MELKNVIHFYFGCDLFIEFDDNSTGTVRLDAYYLRAILNDWIVDRPVPTTIKPILRKLEDMTDTEFFHYYGLATGIFTEVLVAKVSRMASNENQIVKGYEQELFGFITGHEGDVRVPRGVSFYIKSFLINDKLSVGEEGMKESKSMFNSPSQTVVKNQSVIFFELLKQGFDLFNLIPSGQAIDQSTLK